jgi:hypothetical protein
MGTIEGLLDRITSDDLGELLRSNVTGMKLPRSLKERISLAAELLHSGQLSFDVVLDITKGNKDWLVDMCDSVQVDSVGTIAVLRERLNAWYASNYRQGGPPRGVGGAPRRSPQSRPLMIG